MSGLTAPTPAADVPAAEAAAADITAAETAAAVTPAPATPGGTDAARADGEPDARRARLIEQEVEAALSRHEAIADCAVIYRSPEAANRACVRCGISERYPGITFDTAGVCDLCAMYTANAEKIHSYFGETETMVRLLRDRARERGSEFDCLLLFSGGKDSTYVLYRLIELGLRVATFTFDNGFISQTALRNVEEITRTLGVRHVTATRADQNQVFQKSLEQHKSVCNGCFRSLLDLSTELAHRQGIPSIVTGLSRGQIVDERLSWFYAQGIFEPAEIERKLRIGREIYHQAGGGVDAAALDSVEVVDFYRYSEVTKDEIRDFLRRRSRFWSQPKDTGFCSSNCMINDVGVYVHNEERGFHNYEAPTRWEVRLGHLERAEADAELQPPVNTARVRRMLALIGYPDPGAGGGAGRRLSAYYVPRRETDPDELRADLARTVPEFLLPARWIAVDRIPREAGEVVREKLAPPRPTRFGRSAEGAVAPRRAAGRDAASLPLTAAQRAFFDRFPDAPARRARALLLETSGPADGTRLRRAVLQLLLRHDALRARFVRTEDGWRQYDGGVRGAIPAGRLNLAGRDPAEETALLRTAVDRLRARLDLTGGPLLQAVAVDRGTEAPRLLLVVHEAIADTVAWRRIVADLGAIWLDPQAATALPAAESFLDPAFLDRTGTPPGSTPAGTSGGAAQSPAGSPAEGTAGGGAGRSGAAREAAGPPGDGTEEEPGPISTVRALARPDAAPAPEQVLRAVADVMGELLGGDVPAFDLVDHTAAARPDGDERVGLLTAPRTVRVTASGVTWEDTATAGIRYDHVGDVSALVPAGGPLTPAGLDEIDFAALPGTGTYALTVTSTTGPGGLRLDWRCGPELRRRLLEAGVADRVADRLAGTGAP